ncbi:DUF262 domain-containing protein [Pseudomonas chlororaphis]|uniref:DUF262 domain-containing protein n=1 Tax=Pseudomonas chlororaphis TaxID=587753 RepID=UPI000F58644C|nr:DUF262 domain-containing protein [Pseudomonas chlororaphis]AZE13287.1 hypothetical protein C4K10_5031 [Pseudomonas chlororaphis subsp. aureofaciens]
MATKPPSIKRPDEELDGEDTIDHTEVEDSSRGDATAKPWDPTKIRITTKHFSLRDVVDQINDEEIYLSPDFQRDYIWKERQRTRLIESVLLGIPLPAFYFNQALDGTYQVVDGVQRLSTVAMFMKDEHMLSAQDLEYLINLDGLVYSKLTPAELRRFRSTQIVVHVIEPQTPDEVKYDIFSRVNTLGSPLSAQEIRHAMSKSRSRTLLKKLSEMEEFDEATEWQYWKWVSDKFVRDSGRMTNRELALRFCAFRNYSDENYRTHPSLDAFLVAFTKRVDSETDDLLPVSDAQLKKLVSDFKRAMKNATEILGAAAFRRWPPGQNRRGPLNRAVFESQAIALADYKLTELRPYKDKIALEFRKAFDDPEYSRAVTVGTGDPRKVIFRFEYTKKILQGILS